MVELGHNGNGDIEAAVSLSNGICVPEEGIEYEERPDTELEFQKPLGTGTNNWPPTPASYTWTTQCANIDPLMSYFKNPTKRDAFMHVSHTL